MVKLVVTDREGRIVKVEAQVGISLMENIRDLDASVDAICGGMCACATCHVLIAREWVSRLAPRSYEEQLMLKSSAHFDSERSRLSCQIRTTAELDGLELAVAPDE